MFRRAMTRRIRMGSGLEELNGAAQALFELDGRRVAERFARGGEVGVRVAYVAGARWQEVSLDRLAEQPADRVGDVIHARGLPAGDVERPAARTLGGPGGDRRGDRVVDVGEVARLLAVAVDRHLLTGGDRGDEERDHGRVLGEGALPRPVDVEVPQHDGLEGLVDPAEGAAVT